LTDPPGLSARGGGRVVTDPRATRAP
jgi:hypothetical protein